MQRSKWSGRVSLALVTVLGAAPFARADDEERPPQEDDDAPVITRHWRMHVHVEQDDSMTVKSPDGSTTDKHKANIDATFKVGTTDDEVGGGAWSFGSHAEVESGGGTYVYEQHIVSGMPEVVERFEGKVDLAQAHAGCDFSDVSWACSLSFPASGPDVWSSGGYSKIEQKNRAAAMAFGGGKVGIFAKYKDGSVTRDGEKFVFRNHHVVSTPNGSQNETATVEVLPLDPAKYEAVFVPDIGYELWMPEGKLDSSDGNALSFHLELRDRKTHRPSPKSFSATLSLESSRIPGVCMNWPPEQQDAPEEPDLFFADKQNPAGRVGEKGLQLELPSGKGSGQVTVTARDFGAYGKLRAHLKVEDGDELDALMPDGAAALAIPKDDNGNHVPDIWEKQRNVKGSTRADADDEGYPAGWAAPGDGYTLYEEFRGFALAEGPAVLRINKASPEKKHQRLDPNARDVIMALESDRPEDEPPLLQGVAMFGQMSGVTLRFVSRASALGKRASDADAMHPRQADFRKTGDRELFGDAVAIWVSSALKDKNPSPAHAQSIHPDDGPGDVIGWPGDISAVYVSRKNALDLVKAEAWFVDPLTNDSGPRYKAAQAVVAAERKKDPSFDPAKSAAYARVSPDALAEHVMAMNVVHELGHTLGAYHHEAGDTLGDVACPMRYWHIDDWQDIVAFVRRRWDLTTAPTGGAWTWCSENLKQLRLRSK